MNHLDMKLDNDNYDKSSGGTGAVGDGTRAVGHGAGSAGDKTGVVE